MPVDTVMPDTFESCLDAMMCGSDCDFLNGLYSLDVIDIMHLVFPFSVVAVVVVVVGFVLLLLYTHKMRRGFFFFFFFSSYMIRWCVCSSTSARDVPLAHSLRRSSQRCPCRCRRRCRCSINFKFYLFSRLLLLPSPHFSLSLSRNVPVDFKCCNYYYNIFRHSRATGA